MVNFHVLANVLWGDVIPSSQSLGSFLSFVTKLLMYNSEITESTSWICWFQDYFLLIFIYLQKYFWVIFLVLFPNHSCTIWQSLNLPVEFTDSLKNFGDFLYICKCDVTRSSQPVGFFLSFVPKLLMYNSAIAESTSWICWFQNYFC